MIQVKLRLLRRDKELQKIILLTEITSKILREICLYKPQPSEK